MKLFSSTSSIACPMIKIDESYNKNYICEEIIYWSSFITFLDTNLAQKKYNLKGGWIYLLCKTNHSLTMLLLFVSWNDMTEKIYSFICLFVHIVFWLLVLNNWKESVTTEHLKLPLFLHHDSFNLVLKVLTFLVA